MVDANDDDLNQYLFEDIQKNIQSWLDVYSSLELQSIFPRDLRFYLWLKMLMDKIDSYETEISDLNKERNRNHWKSYGKPPIDDYHNEILNLEDVEGK